MKLAPLMFTSLSVGTICSSKPLVSRSSRTRPVVALVGTAALMVWLAASTVLVTATSDKLPLSSSVLKTSRSPACSPLPAAVMVWPVLAAGSVACAAVPLPALALRLPRWLKPTANRSRLKL